MLKYDHGHFWVASGFRYSAKTLYLIRNVEISYCVNLIQNGLEYWSKTERATINGKTLQRKGQS